MMDIDALARVIHEEIRTVANDGLELCAYCDECDERIYFNRSELPSWWEMDADEREAFLSAARAAVEFLRKHQQVPTGGGHVQGG